MIVKRKLRLIWTCSDYVHHEHRYKWIATLCGRAQWAWHKVKVEMRRFDAHGHE